MSCTRSLGTAVGARFDVVGRDSVWSSTTTEVVALVVLVMLIVMVDVEEVLVGSIQN